MRVIVGERLGGPEVLSVAQRAAPRPGPGEIVVDVAAAGVNFMDIYQREGAGGYQTEPPFVPGGEGAGTVAAVGEDTFDDSLAALRPRGMMVLYGAASGAVPPVDPDRLRAGGSLFLTRPTMASYIADAGELRWRAGEVFDWMAKGELEVRISRTYPLADAARAQEDLAARRTTGKLLLLPGL